MSAPLAGPYPHRSTTTLWVRRRAARREEDASRGYTILCSPQRLAPGSGPGRQARRQATWRLIYTWSAALGEAVFVGVRGGGGARWHPELGEDVADVAGDGLIAEEKVGGDGAVALT